MRALADQAMKLHEYMIKHWHKDVPLHACIAALERADSVVSENYTTGDDICFKAGEVIQMAIEELKEYKMRKH